MLLHDIFHEMNFKRQETPKDYNYQRREYIKKSLRNSTPSCIFVEEIAPVFEGYSNREFNRKINHSQLNLERKKFKWDLQQSITQYTDLDPRLRIEQHEANRISKM